MRNFKKNLIFTIISVLFFYICLILLKFFEKNNLIYIKWFFYFILTVISGTLIPIILKNRFKFEYTKKIKKTNSIIGLIILILTLLTGLVFSRSIMNVIEKKYSIINLINYILFFFPFTLGFSFFSFLIIPEIINKFDLKKYIKLLISISLIFLFFFLGFFIDSNFKNLNLAIILAFFGLSFSLSNWFNRNFWISFIGFFILILSIKLEGGKYIDYPLFILTINSIITLLILIFDNLKFKSRK